MVLCSWPKQAHTHSIRVVLFRWAYFEDRWGWLEGELSLLVEDREIRGKSHLLTLTVTSLLCEALHLSLVH